MWRCVALLLVLAAPRGANKVEIEMNGENVAFEVR
jgi:hypothetical protein